MFFFIETKKKIFLFLEKTVKENLNRVQFLLMTLFQISDFRDFRRISEIDDRR